jgi:hypothetical protein
MKRILSVLAIAISLYNCSSKSEKEALFEDVMKVHDELMPKLGDISSLSQDLKVKSAAKSSDRPAMEAINKKVVSLQNASGSMMQWMRSFNTQYDTLPEKIAVDYLKEEKLEVEQLKKEMDSAISEAEKELKK